MDSDSDSDSGLGLMQTKKKRKTRKDKGKKRTPYGRQSGSLADRLTRMKVGDAIYTTQEDKNVQALLCRGVPGKFSTRRFYAVPSEWADQPPVRLTEVTRQD